MECSHLLNALAQRLGVGNLKDLKTMKNLIKSAENQFEQFEKNAQTGFDYYNNKGKIKSTGAAAIDEINSYLKKKGSNPLKSADNRIGLNRHMIVVDQKIGYLLSSPPVIDVSKEYQNENSETLLSKIKKVLGKQFSEVIKQLGIDAANTGTGWLGYWEDENGQFDYYYINPLTIMPIYDYSKPKKELQAVIRRYKYANQSGEEVTRYEIWDKEEVAYLIKKNDDGKNTINFEDISGNFNIQPHTYGRVPFIPFKNNAKGFNDLQMYKDIIDAMDKLVSGFANDIDDIQEIIWVIKNYTGETSKTDFDVDGNEITKEVNPLQMLKAEKWLSVDDKGGVEAVTGDIPYEARQVMFDLLDKEFWKAAMAVDPNPERVGNQSGEYMEFLYGLLEQKASLTETMFRTALDEFLQAIVKHLGTGEEIDFTQSWYRTKPRNDKELVEIINSTPAEVMSYETKTKLHPLIEDAESEREQIEAEQQERADNFFDRVPESIFQKE